MFPEFHTLSYGSDKMLAQLGVPFKYSSTITTHTRFVQGVQFSPSGDAFASVASDMKAFIYNGQTGETLGELPSAHKGSIVSGRTS
jgi:WD40 repeat protein